MRAIQHSSAVTQPARAVALASEAVEVALHRSGSSSRRAMQHSRAVTQAARAVARERRSRTIFPTEVKDAVFQGES
jgi:hypothetical protein